MNRFVYYKKLISIHIKFNNSLIKIYKNQQTLLKHIRIYIKIQITFVFFKMKEF